MFRKLTQREGGAMRPTSIKLVGVLLLIAAWIGVAAPARALVKVPDFALPTVQDQKIVDITQFRGKAVLINFWATWCGPCVEEIPSLISLQKEFGPQGLRVIGVSMDQGGEAPVQRVIEKIGINYPVVMGDDKMSRDFGGIFGVPASFLVDQSGNVRKRFDGWTSHDDFVLNIKQVLQ
jgi:thiol-disulfide isomerase/thioredoxin